MLIRQLEEFDLRTWCSPLTRRNFTLAKDEDDEH